MNLGSIRNAGVLFISLLLIPAGYFTVYQPKTEHYSTVAPVASAITIILLALPSMYYLVKWMGKRKGLWILLIFSLYALTVETFALQTGVPYGQFVYSDQVGYKLFGITPWTVPFAWIPILLGGYSLSVRYSNSWIRRVLHATFLMIMIDTVIEPGAVELAFWQYGINGPYYTVPLSNFAGWFISSFWACLMIFSLSDSRLRKSKPPIRMTISAFWILIFWTSISYTLEFYAPVIIGVMLIATFGYQLFLKRGSTMSWRKHTKYARIEDKKEPIA